MGIVGFVIALLGLFAILIYAAGEDIPPVIIFCAVTFIGLVMLAAGTNYEINGKKMESMVKIVDAKCSQNGGLKSLLIDVGIVKQITCKNNAKFELEFDLDSEQSEKDSEFVTKEELKKILEKK